LAVERIEHLGATLSLQPAVADQLSHVGPVSFVPPGRCRSCDSARERVKRTGAGRLPK
jgi:hypothetical protein